MTHWKHKHGYATAGKTPEYLVWLRMKSRCNYKGNSRYHSHGARGIKVCERWLNDFVAFLSDMGPRPSPLHTLDRINNDGDYTPENCRWATQREQANNRRSNRFLECDGESKTLAEWSYWTGLNVGTLHARLKMGWPVKDALTRPLRGQE